MMNRMVMAIALGLLGMTAYYMVGDNQKEMRDQIHEIDSGIPRWKESEFTENIAEMKSYLREAMAALANHDQAASFSKYHRVVAHWKHYPSFYPRKEIEPGVAVEDWYEELQETYREAMRGEFDLIVAGLESGERDSLWLRDFGHNCEQVGLDDMAEQLETEKERIGRIRTVAAAKWFRVTFSSIYPDYE